ncbi:hypothetical protein HanIR_Chr08g0378171 [Helianthus annuus]|nr:hypothetical protein HanIR_Chr08g0378171 [Helianthus annuus]
MRIRLKYEESEPSLSPFHPSLPFSSSRSATSYIEVVPSVTDQPLKPLRFWGCQLQPLFPYLPPNPLQPVHLLCMKPLLINYSSHQLQVFLLPLLLRGNKPWPPCFGSRYGHEHMYGNALYSTIRKPSRL